MNDIYMLRYMYKYVKLQYVKVFLFDLAVVPWISVCQVYPKTRESS